MPYHLFHLEGTVPAFEYLRDLPPQVHFIGPSLLDPPTDFIPHLVEDLWQDQ